jgi:hypothetical protein
LISLTDSPAGGSDGDDLVVVTMKTLFPIDNTEYDLVQPSENQLYVGWTESGEWFNVTVEVADAGMYSADVLYTPHQGGSISLDVNGKAATERFP